MARSKMSRQKAPYPTACTTDAGGGGGGRGNANAATPAHSASGGPGGEAATIPFPESAVTVVSGPVASPVLTGPITAASGPSATAVRGAKAAVSMDNASPTVPATKRASDP